MRRWWVRLLWVLWVVGLYSGHGVEAAESRDIEADGLRFSGEDVTGELVPLMRGMRFNEALEEWNVDLVVTNTGGRTFPLPVFVVVEELQNSGGVIEPDGATRDGLGKPAYLALESAPLLRELGVRGATEARTVRLRVQSNASAPRIGLKVYGKGRGDGPAALGFVRTLTRDGLPLPGVNVVEQRLSAASGAGVDRTLVSDAEYGVVTLGGVPGRYQWKFEAENTFPVWRRAELVSGQIQVIPSPRLTLRPSARVTLGPLGGLVAGGAGNSLRIAPGVLGRPTALSMTGLDPQTLPAFLPQGWSPLSAFWVDSETPLTFQGGAVATLLSRSLASAGEPFALVRLQEQTLTWNVVHLGNGRGTNAVELPIPATGAYALVVRDSSVMAPPAPQLDRPLLASVTRLPAEGSYAAEGLVQPARSAASRVAEQVTATATVLVTSSNAPIPSGVVFRGRVHETYQMQDGSRRFVPSYEHHWVGYQKPGDALDRTVQAAFPTRPILLFGNEDLAEATVSTELFPLGSFQGGVFPASGGVVQAGDVRVRSRAGDFLSAQAAVLTGLSVAEFASLLGGRSGFSVVAAFDLAVGQVETGRSLGLEVSKLLASRSFVLARVVTQQGVSGLEPVERMETTAGGALVSAEPISGERLPGIRGAGQFVLVQVESKQTLVAGLVVDAAGEAAFGFPVQIQGLPWMTFVGGDASYRLVAPAGSVRVVVNNPSTGESDIREIVAKDNVLGVVPTLETVDRGPRVVEVQPGDRAERVSLVTSVVVKFNEALRPERVVPGSVQVVGTNGAAVPATLSLGRRGTEITLLPERPLGGGQTFRVLLSGNLTDLVGNGLEGPREFTFTTRSDVARGELAKLTVFEPGATNLLVDGLNIKELIPAFDEGTDRGSRVVAYGSPGTADGRVPVILVNETSGETSTVLSKVDGSFAGFVRATPEDYISAVFVNVNGTRTTVSASRQQFDDGRVGLYQPGGILEAESDGGPIRVLIEPDAVSTRSTFKIAAMKTQEVLEAVNNTAPEGAKLLGGIRVELGGDPVGEGAGSNVSIPFDPASLNLPAGERVEDGVFALAIPRTVNGETAYQVVDKLRFKDGKLESNTLPFLGFLAVLLAENVAQEAITQVGGFVLTYLFVGNQQIVITGRTLQTVDVPNPLNATFAPTRLTKPLAGVQVTASPVGVGLGRPGRIGLGTIFSTSGTDGVYALVVARKTFIQVRDFKDYLVMATHPAFEDAPNNVLDTTFGTAAVEYDFVFSERLNAGSLAKQPRITTSITPRYPALGEATELKIIAEHLHGPPSIDPTLVPRSLVSLVPGVNLGADPLQMTLVEEVVAGRKRISRYRLVATNALQASIRIVAIRTLGQSVFRNEAYEFLQVGAGTPVVPEKLIPADPGDVTGPTVVGTFPQENGMLPPGERLAITFNEPIARSVTNDSVAVGLASGNGNSPGLQLSEDQRTLFVTPGLLSSGIVQELILTTAIRDLAGNPLKRTSTDPQGASHTVRFRVAPLVKKTLSDLQQGGGAVVNKGHVFALERNGEDGAGQLAVYDLATLLGGNGLLPVPAVARRTIAAGFPRDLTLIPQYSFRRKPGGPVETKDLLAVVGGVAGFGGENERGPIPLGQLLRVFDISDPTNPTILVGARLSLRSGVVNVVRWSPPHLTYLESGVDLQQVGIIDLQEMIVGFLATPQEAEAFPLFGVKGKDNNGDGDYVDEEDQFPLPEKTPAEFFGKKMGLVVEGTTQLMQDYAYLPSFDLGVTILNRGKSRNSQGEPVGADRPPSLRVLLANGSFVNPPSGVVNFDPNLRPQRVFLLPGQDLVINGLVQTLNLALVSLSPDGGGAPTLAVCDVTFPNNPTLLGQIPLPESTGIPKSMVRLAGGLVSLFMAEHQILIDPSRLLFPLPPGTMLHPSIVSVNKGTGSGNRTLAPTEYGLNVVSLGSRNEVHVTAPKMRFVHFPASTGVIQPGQLVDNVVALTNEFGLMRSPTILQLARVETAGGAVSSLSPPTPVAHYHVLIEAPGQAGASLLVALESLNESGHPLKNMGPLFPPVRSASATTLSALGQAPREGRDAPAGVLKALRLSSDPNSPFYNRYLTQPFVLVSEKIKALTLSELKSAVPREILWSGALVRASLDPETGLNGVLGEFASVVDGFTQNLRPGIAALGVTIQGHYLFGPNPPPVDGELSLPGTFGMVNAGNGEFRTSTVDMELPSRRMPIVFSRSYGGQDLFDGPFGRGWDFLYGQRLIEYQAQAFPEGSKKPLVIRALENAGSTVESGDVVFQTGEARIIHFKLVKGATPPELTNDPLLKDSLKWFDAGNRGATYYLPGPGEKAVFDVLCRFPGGEFCRVTPEGLQYWYSAQGRLERVYDRYPKNRHVLVHNERGELVKIVDESVTSDRYMRIGYYRLASDGLFSSDVDVVTSNPHLAGRIAKLKDYTETTEREVIYEYHDRGTLERRLGYKLAGVNGGFEGRPVTRYNWDASGSYLVGVVQGNGSNGGGANSGTPLFGVQTQVNDKDAAVATGGNGAGGKIQISVPVSDTQNSAATIAALQSKVVGADGANTEARFDANGYPSSLQMSVGSGLANARYESLYDGLGRLKSVRTPEGGVTTYEYAVAVETFRGALNVRKITIDPGPRGGETLTASYDGGYDLRYNLVKGTFRDFNGKTSTYQVREDGRDLAGIGYGDAGEAQYTHNEYGQLIKESTPEGVQVTMEYDGDSGFLTAEQRGDNRTTYGYGAEGGFTSAGVLGQPTVITPPTGAASRREFDSHLSVTRVHRGSFEVLTGYNENGNRVFLRRTLDAGQVYQEEMKYDQISFMTERTVKGVEVNGELKDVVIRYKPDAAFRTRSMEYPDGKIRSFQYDHFGRLTRMSVGSSVDADDYHEEYTRDLNGNLKSLTTRGDLVKSLTYDGHDRLIEVRNKLARGEDEVMRKTYFGGGQPALIRVFRGDETVHEKEVLSLDALGRPKSEVMRGGQVSGNIQYDYKVGGQGGLVTTITGPRDVTVITTDKAGRVVGTRTGLGSITYKMDGNGNLLQLKSEEDGVNYTTDYTYDELDHRLTQKDGVGQQYQFQPRLDGLSKQATDAKGNAVRVDFTALGEVKSIARPEGLGLRRQYDFQRLPHRVADSSGAGELRSYDSQSRLTSLEHRSGALTELSDFDNRNHAQRVKLPGGGTVDRTGGYDLQGRLLSQKTISEGRNYEMSGVNYDALGRVRKMGFGAEGQNGVEFTFDGLGPLVRAKFSYAGVGGLEVSTRLNSDGSRNTVTYPSGAVVTEEREASGRLKAVRVDGANVWEVRGFKGSAQRSEVIHGGVIRELNEFDLRRRLILRRYETVTNAGSIAEMRFKYDAANNLMVRQMVDRQGRGDYFEYDRADRLVSVEYGVRPSLSGTVRVGQAGLSGGEGLSAGWGRRNYTYDTGALDLLLGGGTPIVAGSIGEQGAGAGAPASFVMPAFARSLGGHDVYLHARELDGVSRGPSDALGNVKSSTFLVRSSGASEPVKRRAIVIQYNALNHLVHLEFEDGRILDYEYLPDGLMCRRILRQGSAKLSERVFVWDEGRLIEEYETLPAKTLVGRYHYADSDWPFCVELPDASGVLKRFFLPCDQVSSVMGLVDETGRLVERMSYDPWGQPAIESRDELAPRVARVVHEGGGRMLIQFSEAVFTPVRSGSGSGLVTEAGSLDGLVKVISGGKEVGGELSYLEDAAGVPFGSVIRFVPSSTLTGGASLGFKAGALLDTWGNPTAAENLSVNLSISGVVFVGAVTNTAPLSLARSRVGNPFLFQGQWFDADAGLVYMRARWYDPLSGQFLQRDPVEYEDSVNAYAGLANNPTTHRDPSGAMIGFLRRLFATFGRQTAQKAAATEVRGAAAGVAAAQTGTRAIRPAMRGNPVAFVVERPPANGAAFADQPTLVLAARPGAVVAARAATEAEVTEVISQLGLRAGAARRASRADLLQLEQEGKRAIDDLQYWASQAQQEGRLKVDWDADLSTSNPRELILGSHSSPWKGLSIIRINRDLQAAQHEILSRLTFLHEVSHARAAAAFGGTTDIGIPRFIEEFSAHMDQLRAEVRLMGVDATRKTHLRTSFEARGSVGVVEYMLQSGYGSAFLANSTEEIRLLFRMNQF